jgi:hypothetical protein
VAGNEYDESEEEYDSEDSNGIVSLLDRAHYLSPFACCWGTVCSFDDDKTAQEKEGGVFGRRSSYVHPK